MRTWLVAMVGFALVGCATSGSTTQVRKPDEKRDSAVVEAPKPVDAKSTVKLVAKTPPAKRYRFVGRVEATAKTGGDFVEAARTANADLRRQAKALGADVIKVEVVSPGKRVVLAGRAYKSRIN
jgi:hypothetical protein